MDVILNKVFWGAFGGGTIITAIIIAVVNHWLARRRKKEDNRFKKEDDRFNDMKTAYKNFLSAYEALALWPDEEKSKQFFKLCEERVLSYGTQETVDTINNLKTTDPKRTEAYDKLVEAMRKELRDQKK